MHILKSEGYCLIEKDKQGYRAPLISGYTYISNEGREAKLCTLLNNIYYYYKSEQWRPLYQITVFSLKHSLYLL